MKLVTWLKIAAAVIALVAAVSVYYAWRATQREQAQLKAALQAAQHALTDADARQQARNAELATLLAQFNQKKTAVQSPAQVVQALPQVLPLPTPLSLPAAAASQAAPSGPKQPVESPNPKVQLPSEDLKPLYDFAVNCQECQAQLAAAQGNLKDEQAKTQAVSNERDAALKAARGGSALRRVARAAKWLAIGAAAGAVAAKLAR